MYIPRSFLLVLLVWRFHGTVLFGIDSFASTRIVQAFNWLTSVMLWWYYHGVISIITCCSTWCRRLNVGSDSLALPPWVRFHLCSVSISINDTTQSLFSFLQLRTQFGWIRGLFLSFSLTIFSRFTTFCLRLLVLRDFCAGIFLDKYFHCWYLIAPQCRSSARRW